MAQDLFHRDGHEADDDGDRAYDSLWDAVLAHAWTTIVGSWPRRVPFLHDDPDDKQNARCSL